MYKCVHVCMRVCVLGVYVRVVDNCLVHTRTLLTFWFIVCFRRWPPCLFEAPPGSQQVSLWGYLHQVSLYGSMYRYLSLYSVHVSLYSMHVSLYSMLVCKSVQCACSSLYSVLVRMSVQCACSSLYSVHVSLYSVHVPVCTVCMYMQVCVHVVCVIERVICTYMYCTDIATL